MQIKFIEATNGPQNWGKFMITRFDSEWSERSAVEPSQPLIAGRGWSREHIFITDLQTGEGAMFRPGGYARHDLGKHQIWVCPLFEPFLEWLYKQDLSDLDALPAHVDLPEAEFMMSGYRRAGPVREAFHAGFQRSDTAPPAEEKVEAAFQHWLEHRLD